MGERSGEVLGVFSVVVIVDSSVTIFNIVGSGFLVKLDTAIARSGCELFVSVLGPLFVTDADEEAVVEGGANVVELEVVLDGFEVEDGFIVKSS